MGFDSSVPAAPVEQTNATRSAPPIVQWGLAWTRDAVPPARPATPGPAALTLDVPPIVPISGTRTTQASSSSALNSSAHADRPVQGIAAQWQTQFGRVAEGRGDAALRGLNIGDAPGVLNWQTNLRQVYDHAVLANQEAVRQGRQPKPIMVEFTADWCDHCHTLNDTTLRSPQVTNILRNYDVVRINMDNPPQDEFMQNVIQSLKVDRYPMLTVLDVSSGQISERGRIAGYYDAPTYAGYINQILSWTPAANTPGR